MNTLPELKQSRSLKYGDCFALGPHRLIFGDSCDPNIIKKLIQKDRISLLLCDIPYGISYVQSKKGFINLNKKDKVIVNDNEQSEEKYVEFNKSWLEAVKPYLSSKNSFYIFNSDKMLFALRKGIEDAGFRFTQILIWIKNQAIMGRMHYLPQHELIIFGWFGKHNFYKSPDRSVLFYPKPNKSIYHPTMKPIPLLRQLILNSSRIGDFVFDGFGGSGQTLLACEQTRRKCLMVEIDVEYVTTIIQRYEKFTGLKLKKIS